MTGLSPSGQPLRADCSFPDAPQRFVGHFPRQTVIPGAVLTDRVLTEIERATGRRVGSIRQVKFVTAALPLDTLMLEAWVTGSLVRFELLRQSAVVCSGTLALESDV